MFCLAIKVDCLMAPIDPKIAEVNDTKPVEDESSAKFGIKPEALPLVLGSIPASLAKAMPLDRVPSVVLKTPRPLGFKSETKSGWLPTLT